ncbi:MAG: hypothetical protein ACRDNL_17765 [Spirillospora sp.]
MTSSMFTRALLVPTLAVACAVPAMAAVTTSAHASTPGPTHSSAAARGDVCKDLSNGTLCFRRKVNDHPQVCYDKHRGQPVTVRLGFEVKGSRGWIPRWDQGFFRAHPKHGYCFAWHGHTVSPGHVYRGVLKQLNGPTWYTPAVRM